MKRARKDTGITLIELVVAMAIFALVAIMGLQSLTGSLRVRDRLVSIDDQNAELGQALALLRNDLSAIAPMLFYPPGRGAPRSALQLTSGGTTLALSLGGQPGFEGATGGKFHRAEWRLDRQNGTLHRRVWTTLIPGGQDALQPETVALTGVSDLSIRTYWARQGWIDGTNNPLVELTTTGDAADGDSAGGAPETYSDLLPGAIEITLTTQAYGPLIMIEGL